MSKPYRPCNGSEGMWFDDRWCDWCARDQEYRRTEDAAVGCKILAGSFSYDIRDPLYPKEWIQDDDGMNPRCTAFTIDQIGRAHV